MAATFAGIQKFTLLDYPDKTACTLFTGGCNFACPFCQNSSLLAFGREPGMKGRQTLPVQEIFNFLESRRGLLEGVCISGGEPLAHSGIADFAHAVKDMGFLVKVDTNGSFPQRLKELAERACIDYVAMDVKNSLGKYAGTVGIADFDTAQVEESIKFLLGGEIPYEFRTTVVREFHTADDLLSIARLISGAAKYSLQRFDNPERALQAGLSAYSIPEMREMCEKVKEVLPCASLRGV